MISGDWILSQEPAQGQSAKIEAISGGLATTPPLQTIRLSRWILALLAIAVLRAPAGFAQMTDGELKVEVLDPSGRGVPAEVELAARGPEYLAQLVADAEGHAHLYRLPLATYRLVVRHSGFVPHEQEVELRSAVPRSVQVVLEVSALEEAITVQTSPPLFEPFRPAPPIRAGRRLLEEALGTTLGRSTVDVVTTMPGWLLEANAVLHPRGSEYDTQYVVDGLPMYENRSIAHAPAFENMEFEAVNVLTAGFPAEYGRRLGGVIALDSLHFARQLDTTDVRVQLGDYGTRIGSFSHQNFGHRSAVSFGLQGGSTDRYLDPPSLENFTNNGSSGGAFLRLSRDLSEERDRMTVYLRSGRTRFLVPNDLVQQAAGQRQDRRAADTTGQLHYSRTLSPSTLLLVRGSIRDVRSQLWSNSLATPVYVLQDRGLREGVLLGSLAFEGEQHSVKVGGDIRVGRIRENFVLAEPDELPEFDLDFRDRQTSTDTSLFVQDEFRAGNFAANLGVRLDQHRLVIADTALSPRLAASYYVPRVGIQVFASYDRIFQTPPYENLLLSSAGANLDLDRVEGSLPVPANRAHFFEVGARRALGNIARIDAKHYWRRFRNFIDDDVFMNTGIQFPITFDSAEVEGTEVRLELPLWRGLSGFLSYSNMLGWASSPVTGGLFIQGGEAEELRDAVERFPISQDQRNTVAAMVRFEFHPRVWASAGIRYGSGLPFESEDDDDDDDDGNGVADSDDDDGDDRQEQPIPRAILDQINFERGRVRPNLSLDFSIGARIWEDDGRRATLQFDLRNLTDRLNVINFSGLFSGTALAPGRQATLQLRVHF